MRSCRCINDNIGSSYVQTMFKYGCIYFYSVREVTSMYDIYNYMVYVNGWLSGEFSECYFMDHFIDISEERKLKINRISNIYGGR